MHLIEVADMVAQVCGSKVRNISGNTTPRVGFPQCRRECTKRVGFSVRSGETRSVSIILSSIIFTFSHFLFINF